MSVRSILFKVLCFVCFLLAVILANVPQFAVKRVTVLDFLSVEMFIGILVYLGRGLFMSNSIQTAFQGDNYFSFYYGESDGNKGYHDIESFFCG